MKTELGSERQIRLCVDLWRTDEMGDAARHCVCGCAVDLLYSTASPQVWDYNVLSFLERRYMFQKDYKSMYVLIEMLNQLDVANSS